MKKSLKVIRLTLRMKVTRSHKSVMKLILYFATEKTTKLLTTKRKRKQNTYTTKNKKNKYKERGEKYLVTCSWVRSLGHA